MQRLGQTHTSPSINRKSEENLGWQPKTPFEEGLKKTVEWFKQNWELIVKSAKW